MQELQAEIYALVAQLEDLTGNSGSFEKENSKLEAYLSDFTTRQGVLLTIAGLLTLLPFFDDRVMMTHFLIWVAPFLLVSIFSYTCSAKRINILPSIRRAAGVEPLSHERINHLLKLNYFSTLKFHRLTNFSIIVFFVSFVFSYYILFFAGLMSVAISIQVLLLALLIGGLRDYYSSKLDTSPAQREQAGVMAVGAIPDEGIILGGIVPNMKTILVDAVDCFVSDTGEIFEDMRKLLDNEYPQRKIILTGANDEQFKQFGLDKMPYDVFTLKHNPEKTIPLYYVQMLGHFGLKADDVVYFEHNPEAVKSAESVGITSYHYDHEKKDLMALKEFLDKNL